jgi:carbon storage regulator
MLILSRKISESIVIDGKITVKVIRVDGDVVKLGIAAPLEVPVHRQEVYEEIQKSNQEALTKGPRTIPRLSGHPTKMQPEPNRRQDSQQNTDRDVNR